MTCAAVIFKKKHLEIIGKAGCDSFTMWFKASSWFLFSTQNISIIDLHTLCVKVLIEFTNAQKEDKERGKKLCLRCRTRGDHIGQFFENLCKS